MRRLILWGALLLFLSGCVKRTILIESDPPGARVWINEHPSGVTPVKVDFITHGRYLFRLRKNGFREVVAREMVRAPVYEWIPLDAVTELLLPIHLEDSHAFRYTLVPQPPAEHFEPQESKDLETGRKEITDPDPAKRRRACLALARARDPSTAERVLAATRDPVPDVRKFAAVALRAVQGKKALPRLIELLEQDPNPEVRWQAAAQLEALKNADAVPALIAALKDRYPVVRAGAAEALKGIPDTRAVPSLIRALRDHDTATRRAAAEALGRIGDRRAVRPLVRALSFHDLRARRRAAASLAQLKDPAASVGLARTLDNWDPKLRAISARALIEFGDHKVIPLVIRYLYAFHPATRQGAAEVLGGMKDPRAVKPLRRAFLREGNFASSHAMLEALKALGAPVEPGWEELDRERTRQAEEINAQKRKREEEEKQKEQGHKKKVQY